MLVIIIVNYKNEQKTIDYVEQELSKIKINHRIIIVNNGATEQSDHILTDSLHACLVHDIDKNYPPSLCYIISNPENSGFAQGNNLGATFAKDHFQPDFILFSNNDIRFLSDNVVEKLIAKLQVTPTAGMIGPKVIGLKGEQQSPEPFRTFWDRHIWMFLSTFFYSKRKKIMRFQLDYAQTAKEGFHYKIMGSFFIVNAKDFYRCGMMDPNTFLYAEEPILSERMSSIGKRVYYYPEATVIHEHGATTSKHLKWKTGSDIGFKSECYYYKTYIGTPSWQIFLARIIHIIYNNIKTGKACIFNHGAQQ